MTSTQTKISLKCLRMVAVVMVALAFGIVMDLSRHVSTNQLREKNYPNNQTHSWENWMQYGLPPCQKPIVIRNAFDLKELSTNNETAHCKYDSDFCVSMVQQRMIKILGEYSVSLMSYSAQNGTTRPQFSGDIKIKDFLTSDKYLSHSIQGMPQIGTAAENALFIGLKNNFLNFIKQPFDYYYGNQIFINRANSPTESRLHMEWGKNVVLQLAGKKRWFLLHPNYSYSFPCSWKAGIYSDCLHFYDIDSQLYSIIKQNNISNKNNDSYMDVVLDPGDVLLVCDVWLHQIQRVTPESYTYSLRFITDDLYSFIKEIHGIKYWIAFDTIIEIIKAKVRDWNGLTPADVFFDKYFRGNPDATNTAEYYKDGHVNYYIEQMT